MTDGLGPRRPATGLRACPAYLIRNTLAGPRSITVISGACLSKIVLFVRSVQSPSLSFLSWVKHRKPRICGKCQKTVHSRPGKPQTEARPCRPSRYRCAPRLAPSEYRGVGIRTGLREGPGTRHPPNCRSRGRRENLLVIWRGAIMAADALGLLRDRHVSPGSRLDMA
jgi:hypothetical protein